MLNNFLLLNIHRDRYGMEELHKGAEDSSTSGTLQYVVVRGTMKAKLSSTLNIRSADLRVLNPIGQGIEQ